MSDIGHEKEVDEIEVTPEMIEVGIRCLKTFALPEEDEWKSAVVEVFIRMAFVSPQFRRQ